MIDQHVACIRLYRGANPESVAVGVLARNVTVHSLAQAMVDIYEHRLHTTVSDRATDGWFSAEDLCIAARSVIERSTVERHAEALVQGIEYLLQTQVLKKKL